MALVALLLAGPAALVVAATAGRAAGPVRPDFADGFAGGPDFWRVTGLPPGDRLNLRAGPSARARTLAKLAEGAVVRNLGCRPVDGGRWCRVQATTGRGIAGWVNGRFLREASAPATAIMDAGVPPVARAACLRKVAATTGNRQVVILAMIHSEANSQVTVGVGAQKAPWRCLVSRSGVVADVMSLTDEGAL